MPGASTRTDSDPSNRENIISVGIDIGTSTTQVVFSRLTLSNQAGGSAIPRFQISEKTIIYQSPLHFTPLVSSSEIDADAVRNIILDEYGKAGKKPSEISTGAVIITGETARKKNARVVVEALTGLAGSFVVATAGPDLESILAGRGSGASALSRTRRKAVANLDVGGGTTNIGVFSMDKAVDTACYEIGGRLIRFSPESMKVEYVAPKIAILADTIGVNLTVGQTINRQQVTAICSRMTEILEEAVGLRHQSPLLATMTTNHGLAEYCSSDMIDIFTFSGGVADCIYERKDYEEFQYRDIGVLLGRAIRKSRFFEDCSVEQPTETIHATVVGAGSHSMNVSGSTILYSNIALPMQNVPIKKIQLDCPEDIDKLPAEIKNSLVWFKGNGEDLQVAFSMQGLKEPTFQQIEAIADAFQECMQKEIATGRILLLLLERDHAKALGQALMRRFPKDAPILCLDGIEAGEGDYIDIGEPLAAGRVLPVVVKTLVFG